MPERDPGGAGAKKKSAGTAEAARAPPRHEFYKVSVVLINTQNPKIASKQKANEMTLYSTFEKIVTLSDLGKPCWVLWGYRVSPEERMLLIKFKITTLVVENT